MKRIILLAMCMILIGVGAAMADTLTYLNSGATATIPYSNAIGNPAYNPPVNYIGDADKFKPTRPAS